MSDFRIKIRCACYLHSNPKNVAIAAGDDHSNFAKWLTGQPTLSDRKISSILNILRLTEVGPDASQIHHWQFNPTPKRTAQSILPAALSLYLGDDFHAARLLGTKDIQIFAFTNKRIHAFMTTTATDTEIAAAIDRFVSWRNPVYLNIDPPHTPSRLAAISPSDFLDIWSDYQNPSTIDDLLATIRTRGLNLTDAVRIISESVEPQKYGASRR